MLKPSPHKIFWGCYIAAIALLVTFGFLSMSGCTNFSLEQRADATYGSYRIATETVADLLASPEISDAAKQRLKNAERASRPAGDALHGALRACKAQPGGCSENQVSTLEQALTIAKGALLALQSTLLEISPTGGEPP